jgi:hypothetical protein
MDDNKKMFTPQLAFDTKFFIAHLSIPERCKTKGAVGTVFVSYCAFGHKLDFGGPQTEQSSTA